MVVVIGRIGMTGTSPTGDQDGQKLKSEVLWWVRRGGSWLQTESNDLRSFFFSWYERYFSIFLLKLLFPSEICTNKNNCQFQRVRVFHHGGRGLAQFPRLSSFSYLEGKFEPLGRVKMKVVDVLRAFKNMSVRRTTQRMGSKETYMWEGAKRRQFRDAWRQATSEELWATSVSAFVWHM